MERWHLSELRSLAKQLFRCLTCLHVTPRMRDDFPWLAHTIALQGLVHVAKSSELIAASADASMQAFRRDIPFPLPANWLWELPKSR